MFPDVCFAGCFDVGFENPDLLFSNFFLAGFFLPTGFHFAGFFGGREEGRFGGSRDCAGPRHGSGRHGRWHRRDHFHARRQFTFARRQLASTNVDLFLRRASQQRSGGGPADPLGGLNPAAVLVHFVRHLHQAIVNFLGAAGLLVAVFADVARRGGDRIGCRQTDCLRAIIQGGEQGIRDAAVAVVTAAPNAGQILDGLDLLRSQVFLRLNLRGLLDGRDRRL